MRYSKKHFPGMGSFCMKIFVLTSIVFVATFTSCNTSTTSTPGENPGLSSEQYPSFALLKYPVQDINRLLDSTKLDYFTLQYISPAGSSCKDPFTLVSYARDSTGGFVDTAAYHLATVDTSNPRSFNGKKLLGNLRVSRASIDSLLTTKKGQRVTDGYLLYTPMLDGEYGYIYYDIEVKESSYTKDEIMIADTQARPCPPATSCPVKPGP